ncbi:EAL domain-containing protein [bacterium]|nr:EAL domain-containing protein [bacterium]MBU1995162.1 EAL domain-containing protein [bacterium]
MDELEEIIKYTKNLTLLYVEDNIEARENTLFIFEEFFDKIIVALDGEDGLEKFKENDIDIIITDINMPRMNGLDMLQMIRKINKHIPVLILSAYNESNFFIESIKLDVDGYLLKPIDMEQFLATLNKIVEKTRLKLESEINLNLLHQYQEATDASSIVSKTDISGNITYVNEGFCKISGYSKEELLGKNHSLLKNPEKSKIVYESFWNTIKNKKEIWQGIFRNISKSGKTYYIKSTVKPILDNKGEIVEFIALMDDITDIMNPKKQFHDLVNSLEDAMVSIIKIEDFEDLNKYYGQIAIVDIEEEFTKVLLKFAPRMDNSDKLFSLGNGEYGLVRSRKNCNSTIDECIDSLKKFQTNVNDFVMKIDGIEYDISIIISIAHGKDAYENAQHGLRELLLSNRTFIVATNLSQKVRKEAEENMKILKMIKDALASGNVISYFQPIVNNKTKEIEKYESLVRLIDENKNIISPLNFLDIAKKGKYYSSITSRILENSFNALASTKADISINLSVIDIEKSSTRYKIFEFLHKHKEDAHRIVFELLEDENVKDFQVLRTFIKYVKNLGVKIAIDDFGAGYSNFERLLDYQPDILKIDGSLIKNIANNEFSLNIVETIVAFAKRQNIKIIAEYVENEEIFNILLELNVDSSQGYFFGKPEQSFHMPKDLACGR